MTHRSGLTPDEQDRLRWVYSILDEDQLADLEAEAYQIAVAEASAPEAAAAGLPLLVKMLVHEMNMGRPK